MMKDLSSSKSSSNRVAEFLRLVLAILSSALIGYLVGTSERVVDDTTERDHVLRTASRGLEAVIPRQQQDEEEDEEDASPGLLSPTTVCTVVGIVLVLILLTVTFEYAKDALEEAVPEDFEVILEKFFGELTVLGFLAVITFIFSQTSLFAFLSERIFDNDEELLEYFEHVHFALFFVMVFFVIQVLAMIHEASLQHSRWNAMDERIRHEESHDVTPSERKTILAWQSLPWYALLYHQIMGSASEQHNREETIFRSLRREFLLDRSLHEPFGPTSADKRLDDTFNFGRYLGLAEIHVLSHAIKVQLGTWGFFAFMTLAFYGVTYALGFEVKRLQWIWISLEWVVYLGNFLFAAHLMTLRNQFLPAPNVEQVDESSALVSITESWEQSLPQWCYIDYHRLLHTRPFLSKWLVAGVPNRQQILFWFDRRGPHFYTIILQAEMLFTGIYAGLLLIEFFPYLFANESLGTVLLYVVVAVAPLVGTLHSKKHVIALVAQVSSIGTYRKEQIIRDVLMEENTTRIVRTFLIMHGMRRVAQYGLPQARRLSQEKRGNFLSAQERVEVEHSFSCFDTDNSDSISKEEFRNFMTGMGISSMDDEQFDQLVSSLDVDGDGEVSKDEFLHWYQSHSAMDQVSLHERAKDLFDIFDEDKSGEITLGEFKDKLDALNMNFTIDDIGSILNQLDGDRSGSIGFEEFEHFVHKYLPRELQSDRS